jgi:hypothetical protein
MFRLFCQNVHGDKGRLMEINGEPVAAEKASRMEQRAAMALTSPRTKMSVSSAYWRTGQGRVLSTGWVMTSWRDAF